MGKVKSSPALCILIVVLIMAGYAGIMTYEDGVAYDDISVRIIDKEGVKSGPETLGVIS